MRYAFGKQKVGLGKALRAAERISVRVLREAVPVQWG